MTEQESLKQNIMNNPLDDLNWLIYADWLEENGDECNASEMIGTFNRGENSSDKISPMSVCCGQDAVLVRCGPFYYTVFCRIEFLFGERCNCSDAIEGWGCPTCENTGWINGCGEKLFGEHPIKLVSILNKEPLESMNELQPPDRKWMWVDNPRNPSNLSTVPTELFSYLRRNQFYLRGGYDWQGYETESEAKNQLGKAVIDYFREKNGLPLLVNNES